VKIVVLAYHVLIDCFSLI